MKASSASRYFPSGFSSRNSIMMILRSAPPSPFARKVRMAILMLGLADRVEIKPVDLNDPADTLRRENPLGKIPALVLDDGTTFYDSRVIVEYLDHLAGGDKLFPRDPAARFAQLRLQALCDGLLDAGVLIVYEGRYRPAEMHVQSWIDRQAGKIARGLAALEQEPPPVAPTIGQVTLACVLGYYDLRLGGAWRKDHPRLVAWLDEFAAAVPAFAATKPE
jgi:glutathione S-transferase